MSLPADSPQDGLLPNSKKIKKSKYSSCSDTTSPHSTSTQALNPKKYFSCDVATKNALLSEIKTAILSDIHDNSDDQAIPPSFLEKLGQDNAFLDKYNDLLTDILSRHVNSFLGTKEELRSWRRRLRRWIRNDGDMQPSRRTRLIHPSKLKEFKEKLIPRIQNLTTRSFESARSEVLQVLEDMRKQEDTMSSMQFSDNVGKKHWWHDFLQANPDINDIWKTKPIKRTRSKTTKDSTEYCQTEVSTGVSFAEQAENTAIYKEKKWSSFLNHSGIENEINMLKYNQYGQEGQEMSETTNQIEIKHTSIYRMGCEL